MVSSSSLRTLQSLNDLKAPQNLNGLRLSESNDLRTRGLGTDLHAGTYFVLLIRLATRERPWV